MVGEDPRGREIARESRWEDVLQTFIVGGSDGGVARALGVETDGPAVAWVRIRRGDGEEGSGEGYPSAAELDVERFESDDGFVSWAYHKLAVEFEIVNEDHRPLRCWWINGRSASKMGEVLPGESWRRVPPLAREAPALSFPHPLACGRRHSSFLSHEWFCWPNATAGHILGKGAALAHFTLDDVEALRPGSPPQRVVVKPKCVDSNGSRVALRGMAGAGRAMLCSHR